MTTLIDITDDIKEGKYDFPVLSFFGHKLFGRRIFVKLGELILLGHLQYTYETDRKVIIIYICFEFRKNKNLRDNSISNLKIKEYAYEDGMDLDKYLTEIRKEIINHSPQTQGYTWSFSARDLI